MSKLLAALIAAFTATPGVPQIAPPDPHVYVVDREASQLYVVVHRAGLFSFLGHDHAIIPMEWQANLCLTDPMAEGAHGALVLQTSTLVIDSDSARALAHMGGGPGEADRQVIRDRMLDADHLAAQQFPEIHLELRASGPPEGDKIAIQGTLGLHGITRTVAFPITFHRASSGEVVLSGDLRIRQRDFGIEPESKAGLVKTSNDVDLHFLLTASPTNDTCTTP